MKLWRKLLCGELALTLALSCAACARNQEPAPESEASLPAVSEAPAPEEPAGPYAIGIVQYADDPTLDGVREAFLARLDEWGLSQEQAAVEVRQANGDAAEAQRVCRAFVEGKCDLIVALGDPAAQAAAEAAQGGETRVLFLTSQAGTEALGIRFPDSPEGNATGFTAARYEESQLALTMQAAPGLKTLGILTGEDTALCRASVEKLQKLCEEKGLTARLISVPEGGDPAQAVTAAAAEVQAVITPEGGLAADKCAAVGKALFAAKKPWVAGSAAPVEAGAVGCVTVPAEEQGRRLADRAVELMAGKPVSQLPVTAVEEKQILLNQAALDGLHLQLAQETLDAAEFISAAPAA